MVTGLASAGGRGVLYLNHGEKCMIRLLVSAHSLRRHYAGPVTLVAVGRQHRWFLDAMRAMGVDILPIDDDGLPPLVRKARMHELTPYDTTMFLDADTLVLKPVDEYFDKIEEYGFCTGEFAGWKTTGGTISRRIKGFGKVVPQYVDAALAYGKATNTGIFGFVHGAPILQEWKELTERGWRADCSRIPDEVACQMLLPRYRHWLAPVEWGTSVKYGALGDAIRIVHYHGRKHVHPFPLCNLWKQEYWAVLYSLPPAVREQFGQPWHDRRLKRYLKRDVRHDLTVVTAVDAKYLDCLRRHLPLWMRTAGICEHPMVCFVHGIPLDSPDLAFLRARARLVAWDLPGAANQRERMLTAFVLGTAKEIQTEYWLKIDADTTPRAEAYKDFQYCLELPGRAWRASLCGHRWRYTKSKGGYRPGHFLNHLDEWWQAKTGEPPIFPPDLPEHGRHRHHRIASFICLHKAAFVRKCAEMAGARLPAPSHDTFLWYCAERMQGESWLGCNFKENFSP